MSGSAPASIHEESHLYPGELNDVIVTEPGRLSSDGGAVEQRIVPGLAAVDMHDEIAFGAPRDRGNLYAWAPERGQRLVELQLAAGERTRQHLQLRFLQRRSVAEHAA